MEKPEPQEQHRWLQKLVGEWTYEVEPSAESAEPQANPGGTESVRSIGGLWIQGEGRGQMTGGGDEHTSLMTLGFDPQKNRFVGTWIGSMMTYLWVYDGWLDESGKVLTLESDGPKFDGTEGLAKYRDVIEFVSDDHRTLSGTLQGADGEWTVFMKTHYRRKS